VFVVVARALFDPKAGLDPPALARTEVAVLLDVITVERVAGDPDMRGVFVDKGGALPIEVLPGFFTADSRHAEAFAVPLLAREDVVDPPELVLTPVPLRLFTGVGQGRLERFDLLPHRGQTLSGQDDHKPPAVVRA
jgi:hypothetical protein